MNSSSWCSARCTACPVVSVCCTLDSARLFTHLDDSCTPALTQHNIFAYPISQQFRFSMKKLHTVAELANMAVCTKNKTAAEVAVESVTEEPRLSGLELVVRHYTAPRTYNTRKHFLAHASA